MKFTRINSSNTRIAFTTEEKALFTRVEALWPAYVDSVTRTSENPLLRTASSQMARDTFLRLAAEEATQTASDSTLEKLQFAVRDIKMRKDIGPEEKEAALKEAYEEAKPAIMVYVTQQAPKIARQVHRSMISNSGGANSLSADAVDNIAQQAAINFIQSRAKVRGEGDKLNPWMLVRDFDPSAGTPLMTFITKGLRGEIMDGVKSAWKEKSNISGSMEDSIKGGKSDGTVKEKGETIADPNTEKLFNDVVNSGASEKVSELRRFIRNIVRSIQKKMPEMDATQQRQEQIRIDYIQKQLGPTFRELEDAAEEIDGTMADIEEIRSDPKHPERQHYNTYVAQLKKHFKAFHASWAKVEKLAEANGYNGEASDDELNGGINPADAQPMAQPKSKLQRVKTNPPAENPWKTTSPEEAIAGGQAAPGKVEGIDPSRGRPEQFKKFHTDALGREATLDTLSDTRAKMLPYLYRSMRYPGTKPGLHPMTSGLSKLPSYMYNDFHSPDDVDRALSDDPSTLAQSTPGALFGKLLFAAMTKANDEYLFQRGFMDPNASEKSDERGYQAKVAQAFMELAGMPQFAPMAEVLRTQFQSLSPAQLRVFRERVDHAQRGAAYEMHRDQTVGKPWNELNPDEHASAIADPAHLDLYSHGFRPFHITDASDPKGEPVTPLHRTTSQDAIRGLMQDEVRNIIKMKGGDKTVKDWVTRLPRTDPRVIFQHRGNRPAPAPMVPEAPMLNDEPITEAGKIQQLVRYAQVLDEQGRLEEADEIMNFLGEDE